MSVARILLLVVSDNKPSPFLPYVARWWFQTAFALRVGWKIGFLRIQSSDFSSPHDFFAIFVGGLPWPIGSMYVIYGSIYHQYTPNVSIYTIHGSYGWYTHVWRNSFRMILPIFWLLLSCYNLKYGGSEILHHQLGWLKAFLNHEMFTSYKPPINPLFIEFIPLFIGFSQPSTERLKSELHQGSSRAGVSP